MRTNLHIFFLSVKPGSPKAGKGKLTKAEKEKLKKEEELQRQKEEGKLSIIFKENDETSCPAANHIIEMD